MMKSIVFKEDFSMKKKDNTEITTNEEQLKEKRKYTKKVQKTKED